MRHNFLSTPNRAETRNCALICRKKGEEMWFWQQYFVCQIRRLRTLYIKRYPTDSAHPNYVQTSA